MMLAIPINPVIYERGDAGVPTTTPIENAVGGRLDSYTHTIRRRGGFESCRVTLTTDKDEALDWLLNGLMRTIVVYGPEGNIVWEGFLETVDAPLGQERRSVSLKPMANRVWTRYTTILGTPTVSATQNDTASQALYGIKTFIISTGKTVGAGDAAVAYLRDHKNPKMQPTTKIGPGDPGGISLALSFAGWYYTFDWLDAENSSTTSTITTTQIQNMTTAYNSTNNWFSTDYTQITASGISDYEIADPNTSYLQKTEALLANGTSAGEQQAWGIYEGRRWKIAPWAGATPTTITYQAWLGARQVYDGSGNLVAPWDVRPDAMYQVADLLDPGPVSAAQDAAARFYAERAVCTIDQSGASVDLEPTDVESIESVLAIYARK